MKQEEVDRLPDEPTQPDDIEIIEVVGMNEEATSPDEDDEVVVSFDEGPGGAAPRKKDSGRLPQPGTDGEEDTKERLLRLRADFDNLRKRIEREREEYYRHATASLVTRLLPILDNFERAIASMRRSGNGESLMEGVALIHRQLLEELRREGLRPVESVGRLFDPSVHEAVATEAGSGLPANVVVEELQRGYHFEARLLRPALVRVSVIDDPSGSGTDAGSEE